MVDQQVAPAKRAKTRSPSYPGIGLEEALEKVRILYGKENRHAAPVDDVVRHWGFRSQSGPALVALAALKKFGLLVDEGSGANRRARLTNDALRILLDDREDASEKQVLIQEAALRPTIHHELWDKFGATLPSDSNLRHTLIWDYGFTDSAVRDFISQYRETLAFAGLTSSDTMSGRDGDKPPEGGSNTMPPAPSGATLAPPTNNTRGREIQIPVSLDEWATLKASFPLSKSKWEQMLAVLKAMEPALVTPESAETRVVETPRPEPSATGNGRTNGLTTEAYELLAGMRDGSVPAYVTGNLERIARENGIEVTAEQTPNQIIDELRRRSDQ